jgi:hypothetical protein
MSENVELPPLPRYVGTCTILYEKILDTIHKSGLYSFICMAFSQPLAIESILPLTHILMFADSFADSF